MLKVVVAFLASLLVAFLRHLSSDYAAGTPRPELMRLLGEAAWYPTVLLPGQGVRWQPVDDRSAEATSSGLGSSKDEKEET